MEQQTPQYRKNPDGSWMNFDQIVEDLSNNLHPDSVTWLQEHTERDARGLHHSLGMGIRNEYGLWDPEHPLTTNWAKNPESHDMRDGVDHSKDHPDAVSNEIIAALWRKHNTK
jgi:hypothetical protein